MRTISDELPLTEEAPQKGSHIIDRMAAFLEYRGMKRAGAKGLSSNWFKLYGQAKLEAALRIAEVAPNVGNYAAYIASVLKADDPASSNGRTAEFGSANGGSNPSAGTIAPKPFNPPLWRQTQAISHERNRMVADWEDRNTARLATLCPYARWQTISMMQGKAWIQAQRLLRGEAVQVIELSEEEWQSAISRARSVGSEGVLR